MTDESLKELIALGKEQGYLEKRELIERLPPEIIDQEQIDDICKMVSDMGIEVRGRKEN